VADACCGPRAAHDLDDGGEPKSFWALRDVRLAGISGVLLAVGLAAS